MKRLLHPFICLMFAAVCAGTHAQGIPMDTSCFDILHAFQVGAQECQRLSPNKQSKCIDESIAAQRKKCTPETDTAKTPAV